MNTTTYDLLRSAVDMARELKIQNVDGLRALLQKEFPQHLTQIEDALKLWCSYVVRYPPDEAIASVKRDRHEGRNFG